MCRPVQALARSVQGGSHWHTAPVTVKSIVKSGSCLLDFAQVAHAFLIMPAGAYASCACTMLLAAHIPGNLSTLLS